jgi:prepilin-type N-terminal cleavage/methylation domain-containing protein
MFRANVPLASGSNGTMKTRHRSHTEASGRTGFTLVELMIVVAIMGCLAAIAIPNFQSMMLRAKRAEITPHVTSIKLIEHAYQAEWDVFTACPLTPEEIPGREPQLFPIAADDNHAFAYLGWVFEGKGYGQYQVEVDGEGYEFTARGQADIDGDGIYAVWEATDKIQARMVTMNNVY